MAKRLVTLQREQKIIDLLKKEASVSGKTLDNVLGTSPAVRSRIMIGLAKEHKEIQNMSSNGQEAEYKWVDDAPVGPNNHEGYPDPTAHAAIQTVSTVQPANVPGPGEVWGTMESNGSTGMIYTLNALNGACQCIKLYRDTEENRNIIGSRRFEVTVLGATYIGDPTHVTFKPLKYCVRRRAFAHASKLREAREALAKIFGIPNVAEQVPVPVPQIVYRDRVVYKDREPEKKEEPKIPENYVDAKSAYMASLERERDIWKEVAMKLLERNS